MLQNGRINSPKLRPRLSEIDNHAHMFRDGGVDKIKYEHEGIVIIFRMATYIVI